MDYAAAQRALIAHGYNLGKGGPSGQGDDGIWGKNSRAACSAFQRGRGLAATGALTPETIKALQASMAERAEPRTAPPAPAQSTGLRRARVIPGSWLPEMEMLGVVCHWTAGTYEASGLARSRYHLLIDGEPKLVRGVDIALNPPTGVLKGYAAHTRGCNSGWIGVSICCMGETFKGQVKEKPFVPGPWPMKREQWDLMTAAVADLCSIYRIPVSPRTVLSHAEVQGTLGIKQAGKWDFTRLAFDPSIIGAKACGDLMRAQIAARL